MYNPLMYNFQPMYFHDPQCDSNSKKSLTHVVNLLIWMIEANKQA